MNFRQLYSHPFIPTLAGIVSLILWSSTIAFTRSAIENMGTFNAAFFINTLSGIVCFGLLSFKRNTFKNHDWHKLKLYLIRVGFFFVLYMVLFNLAIGFANTRIEVIVVGIINYLWPSLIFLFSVPILKEKANYFLLALGIIVAFLGTSMAITYGNDIPVSKLWVLDTDKLMPYFISLLAAIAWGIYSNLTRRYQFEEDDKALPVLFLMSGIIILLLQLLKGETPQLHLSGSQYFELAYIVLFPSALAYLLWDVAMKRGNKKLITTLSYMVPLASTAISSYYLQIQLNAFFWLACLLVIAGAVLCAKSIH